MYGVVFCTYSVPLEQSGDSLQEQFGMFSELILRVFPPRENRHHHTQCSQGMIGLHISLPNTTANEDTTFLLSNYFINDWLG